MRLTLLAAVCLALSACATIPPGRAGVVLRPDGVDREPLPEGMHFVGPLASVETYDLRAQEQKEDMAALSAEGMMLEANASVLTFHPVPSELVELARQTGPRYYQVLVKPIVRSSVRRVLAAYRADALDTPAIGRAERQITEEVTQRLRPYHVAFDSISLRFLRIAPDSTDYHTIVATAVNEQKAITARQLPELARRHDEELRAEARGIAESHALVAPTLSPAVLNDSAIRAWSRLLAAPSTHVEVRPGAQPYVLEVEP
jgi:regulator of protease activity HflC (stomatin/prohibitin superfamily)